MTESQYETVQNTSCTWTCPKCDFFSTTQIERTFKEKFKKEGDLYLACNDKKAFFTSIDHTRSYQNVCDALSFLLIIFTLDLFISYTDKLLIFR